MRHRTDFPSKRIFSSTVKWRSFVYRLWWRIRWLLSLIKRRTAATEILSLVLLLSTWWFSFSFHFFFKTIFVKEKLSPYIEWCCPIYLWFQFIRRLFLNGFSFLDSCPRRRGFRFQSTIVTQIGSYCNAKSLIYDRLLLSTPPLHAQTGRVLKDAFTFSQILDTAADEKTFLFKKKNPATKTCFMYYPAIDLYK